MFYRLNVVPVNIPPLKERRDDISTLAEHFLARFAADRRLPAPNLSPEAVIALEAHDWPGNVRQLRNVIERIMILTPVEQLGTITPTMLPAEVMGESGSVGPGQSFMIGSPLREARETFEREYLRVQIRRFAGNVSRTAAFIGMERSALHRKLKLLGLAESRLENGDGDRNEAD